MRMQWWRKAGAAALVAVVGIVPLGATAQDGLAQTVAQGLYSTIASIFQLVTTSLVNFMFALIEAILVPILQYNNFAGSRVIDLGWTLVRDVMNMGVIIILLALAIMTMLNVGRANWRQQIPALFIAVAAMNFSRLLCGLLIDLSQVIMFTFVNAILDIGAGNFAQLLGLTNVGNLNFSEGAGSPVLSGGAALGSAVLQLALMMAVFAVLVCLAIAFLWRIVILWVLVILSPIAFFFRFAPDVIDIGFGKGGDWWGKFTGALVMGPMLSFFLWLALALSSSGNLLSAEGFPEPAAGSTAFGNILDSLSSSSIGATLLALIFLVVGMDMAGKSASALGGVASQLINEGMGRKIVKGSLKGAAIAQAVIPAVGLKGAMMAKGAAQGAYGAEGFANQRDMMAPPRSFTEVIKDTDRGARRGLAQSNNFIDGTRQSVRDGYKKLGDAVAGAGGILGIDSLVRLGDKARQQAGADSENRQKEGKEAFGSLTTRGKVEMLANIAQDPGLPQDEHGKNVRLAAQADLLTNKALQAERQKALQASVAAKYGNDEAGKKAAEAEAKKLLEGEISAALKRMGELEAENDLDPFMKPDELRGVRNRYIDLYAGIDEKKAQALIDSDKFSIRDMRDEAIDNGKIVEALQNATQRTTKDGRVTRWEEIQKGGAGKAKKDKAQRLNAPNIRAAGETDQDVQGRATNTLDNAMQSPTDPNGPRRAATREEISINVAQNNIRPTVVTEADINGDNATALNEVFVENMTRVNQVGSGLGVQSRTESAQDAYLARLESLGRGLDQDGRFFVRQDANGNMALRDRTEEENKRMYKAQQLADEENLRRAATGSAASDAAARREEYKKIIDSVRFTQNGQLDMERVRRLIAADRKNIRFLNNPTTATQPDVQREIVQAISSADIIDGFNKLKAAIAEHTKTPTTDTAHNVAANRDFLNAVIASVRAEAARVVPVPTGVRADSEEYRTALAKKNARLAEVYQRTVLTENAQQREQRRFDANPPAGSRLFNDL